MWWLLTNVVHARRGSPKILLVLEQLEQTPNLPPPAPIGYAAENSSVQ